jgi:hypothetical protein
MLNVVKEFIEELVDEIDKTIIIDSEVIYGNKKLEYALSTESHMASISVLSDLTYDFFVVKIESEDTLLINTKKSLSIKELFAEITIDITSFSKL